MTLWEKNLTLKITKNNFIIREQPKIYTKIYTKNKNREGISTELH